MPDLVAPCLHLLQSLRRETGLDRLTVLGGRNAKEILVTLPGTNYAVTYFKRDSSFGLLAKDIVQEDDHRLPHMTAAQFLAKAWKLANEKARERGWIA